MENKEKQIKKKILNLYKNLKVNENEEITNIKFYKQMQIASQEINSMALEEDIYIVEKEVIREKNVKEKVYELYLEEAQRVAIISKDGEIIFDEGYLALLKERYKNLYEKIKIEDSKLSMDKILEENKEKEQVEMKQEELEEKKQEKSKENEMKQISRVTGISQEEIRASAEINPNQKITYTENFYDIVPNTKKYTKIYVVASNASTKGNSRFYFVGVTKDGITEPIEGLEVTEGTNPTEEILSINRDGSEVKEQQVSALFKVGDYNRGLAVSIGQTGIIEADYVRRTPDDKYISSKINTTTNQIYTTKEVENFMSHEENAWMQDNVDKAREQIEESESRKTNIKNIDDNEYNDKILDVDEKIELDNGQVTTIREEAQRMGIELDEYVRRCEEEKADTIQEKVKNTNRKIEEEITGDEENEGGRTPWGDAYDRMNRTTF